jgi:Flp pilus assembly protein TadG
MRPTADPGRDAGTLSLEFAMAAPLIFLILSIVFLYGRVALCSGTLQSGVRDAARAATQSRSADEADARAREVILQALGPGERSCRSTLRVEKIDLFEPGHPVTVTATCQVSLTDLGLDSVDSVGLRASFSSTLDPNRGTG